MLLTNLLLVGWVIAIKGGRLKVSTLRRPAGLTDSAAQRLPGRAEDVRLVLAAGLLGSAAIHLLVVPEHLIEWPAAGVFFVLLAAAEIVAAGLVLTRLRTAALLIAVGGLRCPARGLAVVQDRRPAVRTRSPSRRSCRSRRHRLLRYWKSSR